MNLQVTGCNHRTAPVESRERLAFSPVELPHALARWQTDFGDVELVIVSTCNRVELYTAAESELPPAATVLRFLREQREAAAELPTEAFYHYRARDAVRHLFRVSASLDSLIVGEAQILSQVKDSYQAANEAGTTGPLTHAWFQAALKTARRVNAETALQQRRVSIPSVAVGDFGRRIFERFDDKQVLVLGAGEMGDETLRYLREEGARWINVVNRSTARAEQLAARWQGTALPWSQRYAALDAADVVVSTTGAGEPIVSLEDFKREVAPRYDRPLFILDLAIPRDFDPALGNQPGVYLYCLDDLEDAARRNREQRDREIPAAEQIVEQETDRFLASLRHRARGVLIRQLREDWHEVKEEELQRLFNKLSDLDDRNRREIQVAFDRLVNKLLHPPLESLRDEDDGASTGTLLEALRKLFRLREH